MRKITNKNNLPDTIVKAVTYDTHHTVPGAVSVSALIDSPRIRMLKKKFDYEEDVSDMLYALLGTAVHHVIERANISSIRQRAFTLVQETLADEADPTSKNAGKWLEKKQNELFQEDSEWITEQTLSMEIDGYLICGTFDAYHKPTKTLYDYKMCSTYAWTNDKSRAKWRQQTNIYATLLEDAGYPVEKIIVVALFRDWNSHGYGKSKDYPKSQLCEMELELRKPEKRMEFIKGRVKAHRDAETSEVLPLCTGTERWADADAWAVKEKGKVKALKLAESEKEAQGWIQESRFKNSNKEYEIEFRPGTSTRCEKYCPVAVHCEQFKELKKIQLENSDKQ
ncbi:MAG TPA: hypothetical protein ACFYEK_01285 [Candidatus Wunengus sp. YC60]|uniref:hypothetical protein n=1 Tax=Candidatus Wunengus sp. YC60 TaxID=3367697 RepID=UPI004026AED8